MGIRNLNKRIGAGVLTALALILLFYKQSVAGTSFGAVQTIPLEYSSALNNSYYSSQTGLVTISGTSETPLFLFVNLSTNTLNAYLASFRIGVGAGSVVTAFRVYRAPVVTSSGTALGIYSGNTSSTVSSQMQTYQSPTIGSNGTLVYTVASASGGREIDLRGSRIFAPGKVFLITVTNNISTIVNFCGIEWFEK